MEWKTLNVFLCVYDCQKLSSNHANENVCAYNDSYLWYRWRKMVPSRLWTSVTEADEHSSDLDHC